MDDLLAARSQMAMSLAFHIIFAAIGIAMPLLMIIAEWKWLRSKDEIYLTLEARERKLLEDFRMRAIMSGVAVGLLALTVFILAKTGAPLNQRHLSRRKPDLTISSAAAPQITLELLLGALAAGAIYCFRRTITYSESSKLSN